jgi:hypothetical protein
MPHVAHLRPATDGVIVEDGKPLAGVELFLGKSAGTNEPCAVVGEVIPVSPDGRFSWAAVQEHNLTDSLINPVELRGKITALCIRHPAKGVMIGAMISMHQSKPLSLHLSCDVAHPLSRNVMQPHTTSTPVGQAQHCKVIAG